MTNEHQQRPSAGPDLDERPVSFLGRPAPARMDLRVVSIPPHSQLAYEPAEWAGALVVVEAGEIELECRGGTCACFGAGSVLFFDGLGLRAVRNSGGQTVLLSAVSRRDGEGPIDEARLPRLLTDEQSRDDHQHAAAANAKKPSQPG